MSANIHGSLDGKRVANCAQWRSRDVFEAMLQDLEVHAHIGEATGLASFEPYLYEVVCSDASGRTTGA